MSYLNPPRLHFAGLYIANVSTVNNLPTNIVGIKKADGEYDPPPADTEDTGKYRSAVWPKGDGSGYAAFNPNGGNEFSFKDVTVRSAVRRPDAPVTGDPVLGLTLATTGRPDAKMADLDTDEEMTSTIYGLRLTLRDPAGPIFLRATMTPASSIDIWKRLLKAGYKGEDDDHAPSSGAYQSTLTHLEWSDVSWSSPLLTDLRNGATDGLLSIKFNVDAYNRNPLGGRITGTIGLATAAEPTHMVVGRHLGDRKLLPKVPDPGPGHAAPVPVANEYFRPVGGINYFPAVVDELAGRIRLDLGNAVPVEPLDVARHGDVVPDIGDLTLAYRDADGAITPIGPITYRETGWYARTAGVVDMPADPGQLAGVAAGPLVIVIRRADTGDLFVEEPRVHVRAEDYVVRLDAEARQVVRLRVTELGKPMVNATVNLRVRKPNVPRDEPPEVLARLLTGLDVPEQVTTDADGVAEVPLTGHDPGEKRFFNNGTSRGTYDGQIYGVEYWVGEYPPPNPSNRLAVLVWNRFPARPVPDGEPLTWHGEIGPVLRSFGNLYPVMTKVCAIDLDTADYEKVVARARYIARRLEKDVSDPLYMPVTRTLSGQRKKAILEWLDNPVLGERQPPPAAGSS